MAFTPEQRRIVEHGEGHALVFATAGSGKTTTLVGRIQHLVTDQGVRPERVLATTFTREARASLHQKLAEHPECAGVRVLTLHALATQIVSRAREMNLTALVMGEEHFSLRLFSAARQELRAGLRENERERASRLWQMPYQDFATYLSIQKGNLRLPYVPAGLPPEAAALVTPPDGGADLYAQLYARHDELRRQEGKFDYDDVIVAAWTLMSCFPALRHDISARWDFVNVDEFQDVNLAQSEMMHLVASQVRSFMAIGDDDQTIYQWRGAHPRFILEFARRYGAQQYSLSSNFRCPLGVIALADRVIDRNRVRAPKRLRATRGGSGVHLHPPRVGEAARIAIQAIREGRDPEAIVVLLRTYAQSAEIEQVLLEERVPYRLVGSAPFYLRPEVKGLTAYIELALADLDVSLGHSLSPERRDHLQYLWRAVANRPSRYLRTADIENIGRRAWRGGKTLAATLQEHAPPHASQAVALLATWLDFLSGDLGTVPGKDVLLDFVDAIGYRRHLIETAPTTEYGEERAGSVDALAEMAQTRSLGDLITHLAELHEQVRYEASLRQRGEDNVPRVTLMTAFRAKGLEWPVVIIPDCVSGIYANKPHPDPAAGEEERRVFYVALTRAREELHLVVGDDDTTPFLRDVDHEAVAAQHDRLDGLLSRDPGTWSAGDTLEAAQLLARHEHQAFIQGWVDREYRTRLLGRFRALERQLEAPHAGGQDVGGKVQQARRALDLAAYAQHGPLELDGEESAEGFGDLADLLAALSEPDVPASVSVQPPRRTDALGRGPEVAAVALQKGMRVLHARFGEGEVLEVRPAGGRTEALIRFGEITKRMVPEFARLEVVPA